MQELIIKLFQAVDSSDWNVLLDIYHADVLYERPGYLPFVGIEQLMNFYQKERIIACGKHNIEQIVVMGDYAACWGQFTGIKKDQSKINELFADVYFFDNRRIKSRRTFFYRAAV